MQIPPLHVILSWPRPNYVDPETRGAALLVLTVIFSALMVLAVCARYYSRLVVKNWYGWDDFSITLALIFALGMNVTIVLGNRSFGWDRHVWDLVGLNSKIQDAYVVAFVAKLLFVAAATLTRMSLIFFCHRMVRDTGISWFRWVLHASMGFVVCYGVTATCLIIWLCSPVRSYWVFPPLPNSQCLPEGTVTVTAGIIHSIADLLCCLLPIPLVMRLQMALKQRMGVCVLLGLGFLVFVAGVARTYYTWKSLIGGWDETWYSYPLWISATVEIDLAVICACAPSLKPLLQRSISLLSSHLSSHLTALRSRRTNPTAGGGGRGEPTPVLALAPSPATATAAADPASALSVSEAIRMRFYDRAARSERGAFGRDPKNPVAAAGAVAAAEDAEAGGARGSWVATSCVGGESGGGSYGYGYGYGYGRPGYGQGYDGVYGGGGRRPAADDAAAAQRLAALSSREILRRRSFDQESKYLAEVGEEEEEGRRSGLVGREEEEVWMRWAARGGGCGGGK